MSSSQIKRVLAGAVALAIAGTALANTNLDASGTGDLFLNIVNTTNNTSYLFDTGIAQSAFNGSDSYKFVLSSDTNLTGFLNATDAYDYSVASYTDVSGTIGVDISGNGLISPSENSAFNNLQARTAVNGFLTNANSISTTSTNSVVIPTGSLLQGYWGSTSVEGLVSKREFNTPNAPYADNAALNTALAFYNIVGSTVTTFAYTWDFNSSTDTLTYGPAQSSVPLPAPLLLLLSGLGLTGIVGRRKASLQGTSAA
jgi:hypothetical protein